MKIEVKLFNELQQYKLREKNIFQIELNQGSSVNDLLEKLEIPQITKYFILVNGRRAFEKTRLNSNDTVVLFSPVDGG